MKAIEFETDAKEGIIQIPEEYSYLYSKHLRIIALMSEEDKEVSVYRRHRNSNCLMREHEKMTKVCNFCGNRNFRNKSVRYLYKHDNKYLFVNNVPCEECDYCGEQYFEAKALKNIESDFKNIYVIGKKPKGNVQVPIEEYAEIEGVG